LRCMARKSFGKDRVSFQMTRSE